MTGKDMHIMLLPRSRALPWNGQIDSRLCLDTFSASWHETEQGYRVRREGFHPKAITDETILRPEIGYIHNNPVRRGYVDIPKHWRYSSAGQYMGSHGLVPIEIIV